MKKKMLWYVCLGLLCCTAIAFVVVAATGPATPNDNAQTPLSVKSASGSGTGNTVPPSAPPVATVKAKENPADLKLQRFLAETERHSVPKGEANIWHDQRAMISAQSPMASDVNLDHRLLIAQAMERVENGAALPGDKALVEEYYRSMSARPSTNPLDQQGGPDAFGYRFVDSQTPDTATYGWIELCGDPDASDGPTGDDASVAAAIGFNFPFYGGIYTTCYVITNGSIWFNAANTAWCASDPETTIPGNPVIAPYWRDQNVMAGVAGAGCNDNGTFPYIRYRSFGDYFVVEWRHNPQYSFTTTLFDYQAILYPDGRIKVQFNPDNMAPGGYTCNVAVGVDAPGAGNGVRYFYDDNVTPLGTAPIAGSAIWFYPGQAEPGRCCYGDPMDPICVENLPVDCATLGGNWTPNLDCSTPCPICADLSVTDNFSLAGETTCGFGNDITETCLGVYDGGEDKVYAWTVSVAGDYNIWLNPGADTWTGILLDDNCPPDAACIDYSVMSSAAIHGIECVNLQPGTYFIMVDTWPAPDCITNYTVWAEPCVPCVVECPGGGIPEGEDCTEPDDFNGGCNSTPNVFSPISCGQTVCGTGYFNGSNRDTDWYEVVTTEPTIFTMVAQAEFPVVFGMIDWIPGFEGSGNCANITGSISPFIAVLECMEGTIVTECMPAGTYWFFVGPQFLDVFECGDYYMTLTCATCTIPMGRCCYNGGVDCAENIESECTLLGGIWTEGLTCADPCPAERLCNVMTPVDAALDPVPSDPWAGMIAGNCGNYGKWVGSFTAAAGLSYHFDLCPDEPGSGSNNFDVDIKICDAAGNILTGEDGSCAAWSWAPNDFTWQTANPGTYYVVLAPYFSYTSHTCTGTTGNTFTMYYYAAEPPPCIPDFVLAAPGSVSGNTVGAGDDCNLREGEDQIVEVVIPNPGSWVFTLCPGFAWDTYLFLSDVCCAAPLAEDDDSWCGLTSEIVYSFAVAGTYYIDVEPFSGGSGAWTLVVSQPVMGRCCYGDPANPTCIDNSEGECSTLGGVWAEGLNCLDNPCEPCIVESPGTPEGEDCAEPDDYNGGCNSVPNVFQDIECATNIHGTSYFNGSNRDTDWYRLNLATANNITLTVMAEFDLQLLIITNTEDCTILGGEYVITTGGPCQEVSLSTGLVPAGIYWLWVGPLFTNVFDCGDYDMNVTTEFTCACEAATELNVMRELGQADAVNLRWIATQNQGMYRVFGTTEKNNDGDPDNGADPQWTLLTELDAPATPGDQSFSHSPLDAYMNYVVVHDCAPRGRCCYGDPQSPTCESPVSEDYCNTLSGTFAAGLNCIDDPCPVVLANDECEWVTPVPLPATFTGTRDGANPDCGFFVTGEGNVWIAFTVSEVCDITLDYCGTPAGTGNAWLNLAYGCPCTGFSPAANPWGWDCPDGNLVAHWAGVTPGTYYYPVLADAANGAVGDYVINVTCLTQATGRCCYDNGCGCDNLTEAQCLALSGVWTSGADCGTPCTPPPDYCVAGATTCDEYIASVVLNTINNATACTGVNNYNDYTAISTTLNIGTAYPYTVMNGLNTYDGDSVEVWIDWNDDFCFNNTDEYFPSTTADYATYSGTVTPPAGSSGTHRMRVRMSYYWQLAPCGIQTYGEVEDYTVVVP